jgi:CDP-diacylglycerol--glycerol-3-phosphate 3-phosphatidyltransferase
MNLPNSLTLLRIFIAPLLVVVLLTKFSESWFGVPQHIGAVVLFLTAAITDWADGYLARKRKQVSRLGILLDPIADKLLVSSALISLVENRLAPAWAVVIIIGREFAVSGLRSIAAAEGWAIAASTAGKFKMVSQVVAITLLMMSSVSGEPPVETKAFPIIAFWTVPEMGAALSHVFGAGVVTAQDVRMILYGLGRAMLWVVVISSCWSMYGYFYQFYLNAREKLGIEEKDPSAKRIQAEQMKRTET